VSLVENVKYHEVDQQLRALREGLWAVVPSPALRLFGWTELESRLCGDHTLDIRLLQRHTIYNNGMTEESEQVEWLWAVLESFTALEQTLFLRFVSGRSRLPPPSEFTTPFCIQRLVISDEDGEMIEESSVEDLFLPQAQTCFFTLRLPYYTSFHVLKTKLCYAIATCQEIDTDFVPAQAQPVTVNDTNIAQRQQQQQDQQQQQQQDQQHQQQHPQLQHPSSLLALEPEQVSECILS